MSKHKVLVSLALAVFIVFLWSVFMTEPVYANDPPDAMIWPGDGGGEPAPPHTIEGYVMGAGGPAPAGVNVYLYYGSLTVETTTDAYGHFEFEGSWIVPNETFWITANGKLYDLGTWCDDASWNQWKGWIITDENGYAYETIHLGRSAIVDVPAAALFSNTKYATLYYGIETTSSFSHTLHFNVAGSGIDTGYTTTMMESTEFEGQPLLSWYVCRSHYAATYWDDTKPGIAKTGISAIVENTFWHANLTSEYLDPNSLTEGYVDIPVPHGIKQRVTYTETGSYTWSASLGVDFAITYKAFSIPIELDTTVTTTSGATNWVSYVIDRTGDTNLNTLIFRAYTSGAILDLDNDRGGIELHVWDISGAG